MAVKDSGKKTHTTVAGGAWGGTCAPILAIETVKSIHGYLCKRAILKINRRHGTLSEKLRLSLPVGTPVSTVCPATAIGFFVTDRSDSALEI